MMLHVMQFLVHALVHFVQTLEVVPPHPVLVLHVHHAVFVPVSRARSLRHTINALSVFPLHWVVYVVQPEVVEATDVPVDVGRHSVSLSIVRDLHRPQLRVVVRVDLEVPVAI